MKRVLVGFAGGVLALLLTAVPAWAQAGSTAQLSGTVKDGSGGVLPGVDVTITQTDTGLKRSAVTGADGAYLLPNLPVGSVSSRRDAAGISQLHADRDRAAGRREPDHQHRAWPSVRSRRA